MTRKKLVPESLNESMKIEEGYAKNMMPSNRMTAAQAARMDAEREESGRGRKRMAFELDPEVEAEYDTFYDPASSRGDLAAVGTGGRYRDDFEDDDEDSEFAARVKSDLAAKQKAIEAKRAAWLKDPNSAYYKKFHKIGKYADK